MGQFRYKAFGAGCETAQVGRIRDGFHYLGWRESDGDDVEFVYSNDDGGYDRAISLWEKLGRRPKLILNTLDVPEHLGVPKIVERNGPKLRLATNLTSISGFVRSQLKRYYSLESDVIYQPAMPVSHIPGAKNDTDFLLVGRQGDPNKRAFLLKDIIDHFALDCDVSCVGGENPGFGKFLGRVSSGDLNRIYNSAQHVFCGGKCEGIGLPFIEKLIVRNGFPIGMSDCGAAIEFAPEFCCAPTRHGIMDKLLDMQCRHSHYSDLSKFYSNRYAKQFSPVEVAQRIINLI